MIAQGSDNTVAVVSIIVSGSVAVLVAGGQVVAQMRESTKRRKQELRLAVSERRREAYEQIAEFVVERPSEVFNAARRAEPQRVPTRSDDAPVFARLYTYGSPAV